MEELRNQDQESLHLRSMVDVKELQRMQNLLSDATGLAAVILEASGQPVTKPSNYPDFCRKIGGSMIGQEQCGQCAKNGSGLYRCHAGLMEFSKHIMVDGKLAGILIGGQALSENPDPDFYRPIFRDMGLNEEECLRALEQVPVRSEKAIKACAELFSSTIEQWVVNIYEQKKNQIRMQVFNQESEHVQEAMKKIRIKARELEQTAVTEKMLSLNASIEAGRAGKAGVGFSVVAEEIGRMANESSAVYAEIRQLVDSVTSSMKAMGEIDV